MYCIWYNEPRTFPIFNLLECIFIEQIMSELWAEPENLRKYSSKLQYLLHLMVILSCNSYSIFTCVVPFKIYTRKADIHCMSYIHIFYNNPMIYDLRYLCNHLTAEPRLRFSHEIKFWLKLPRPRSVRASRFVPAIILHSNLDPSELAAIVVLRTKIPCYWKS